MTDDEFISEVIAVLLSSLTGYEHWIVFATIAVWVVSGKIPPFLKKAIQKIAIKKGRIK